MSPLQRALNSGQGLAEEIAESREKTFEVIPRNHVSRVFNASNLDAGLQIANFCFVPGLNHAAAAGNDQQGRDRQVRQILMKVHLVEIVEGADDGMDAFPDAISGSFSANGWSKQPRLEQSSRRAKSSRFETYDTGL